jgi:hypothetical protein
MKKLSKNFYDREARGSKSIISFIYSVNLFDGLIYESVSFCNRSSIEFIRFQIFFQHLFYFSHDVRNNITLFIFYIFILYKLLKLVANIIIFVSCFLNIEVIFLSFLLIKNVLIRLNLIPINKGTFFFRAKRYLFLDKYMFLLIQHIKR